jgi:hypothetical protein
MYIYIYRYIYKWVINRSQPGMRIQGLILLEVPHKVSKIGYEVNIL